MIAGFQKDLCRNGVFFSDQILGLLERKIAARTFFTINFVCKGNGRTVVFETSVVSAYAFRTGEIDGSVPDLSCHTGCSPNQVSVIYDSCPDTLSDGDIHQHFIPVLFVIVPILCKCSGIGVLFNKYRDIQCFLQIIFYRDIVPSLNASHQFDSSFFDAVWSGNCDSGSQYDPIAGICKQCFAVMQHKFHGGFRGL